MKLSKYRTAYTIFCISFFTVTVFDFQYSTAMSGKLLKNEPILEKKISRLREKRKQDNKNIRKAKRHDDFIKQNKAEKDYNRHAKKLKLYKTELKKLEDNSWD